MTTAATKDPRHALHSRLPLVMALAALSGCATITEMAEKADAAVERMAANAQQGAGGGSSSFDESGLADVFLDHPYDESRTRDPQWPRVAVTVLSSPPSWNGGTMFSSDVPSGCYEMEATIWRSETDRTDTEPFDWCYREDVAYDVALIHYSTWASGWGFYTGLQPNSGTERTDGPLPPLTFVPMGVRYRRAAPSAFSTGADTYDVRSPLGLMVYSIAAKTGIDPGTRADHRLWFTRIAPVE